VQLQEIQISKLNLEIEKLKKDTHDMHMITELEGEVKELRQRVADQEYSLTRKDSLLGARHLVWDEITKSMIEFRLYLDFMEDKDALACKDFHRCVVVNETMAKQTLDIAHNAINLLNSITNEQLHTMGGKDRIMVIIWARRVIFKHNFVNNIKTKA